MIGVPDIIVIFQIAQYNLSGHCVLRSRRRRRQVGALPERASIHRSVLHTSLTLTITLIHSLIHSDVVEHCWIHDLQRLVLDRIHFILHRINRLIVPIELFGSLPDLLQSLAKAYLHADALFIGVREIVQSCFVAAPAVLG